MVSQLYEERKTITDKSNKIEDVAQEVDDNKISGQSLDKNNKVESNETEDDCFC